MKNVKKQEKEKGREKKKKKPQGFFVLVVCGLRPRVSISWLEHGFIT